MPNQDPNNGRNLPPDENRPSSWGAYDQGSPRGIDESERRMRDERSYRDRDRDRDDERSSERYFRDSPRSDRGGEREEWRPTERFGQGQSGAMSGRSQYDDRPWGGGGAGYPTQRPQARQGRYEDRDDERFTGRGGPSMYGERSYERSSPYESERLAYGRGYGYDDGDRGYGYQGSHETGYGQRATETGYRRGGFESPSEQQRAPLVPRSLGPQHRGPHYGKGPIGYQRSDERIREVVCDALTDDDQIDASNIEVAVKAGEVILTGTVEDRRIKRMVEDVVERVMGVRDIQNQLRVSSERRGGMMSGPGKDVEQTQPPQPEKKQRG